MEGKIIVDDVLTSCYPSYNHDVAHFGMVPMRWFPELINWMFGADNGFSAYVIIAEGVGVWSLPFEQMY